MYYVNALLLQWLARCENLCKICSSPPNCALHAFALGQKDCVMLYATSKYTNTHNYFSTQLTSLPCSLSFAIIQAEKHLCSATLPY